MRMSTPCFAAALLVLLSAAEPAVGQPNPAEEEERACWEIVCRRAAAWNARDAEGLGDCFSIDAEVTTADGEVLAGRQEIASRQLALFREAARGLRLRVRLRSMQSLGPDGMLIGADHEFAPARGEDLDRENEGHRSEPPLRVTYALVRREGRWSIAAEHQTRIVRTPGSVTSRSPSHPARSS